MDQPFLNFQKFYDRAAALDMIRQLKTKSIATSLDDAKGYFDPSFANNPLQQGIWVQVRAADFSRASEALETFYIDQLDQVSPDYYLFSLSDRELVEIIHSPDQWGYLDYPLAIRILQARGIEWSAEEMNEVKKSRLQKLAIPDELGTVTVGVYYLMAVICWPAGFIIGGILRSLKKTLPNGTRTFGYAGKDRRHGTRLLIVAGIACAIWLYRLMVNPYLPQVSLLNF